MNLTDENILPDYFRKPVLVLGCGNVLMGDDGFGPRIAEILLNEYDIPGHAYVLDIGSSARELLLPLVMGETNVQTVVIIDAVDLPESGRKPGETFEIMIEDIPYKKIDDFSMHQVPSSNLLKELRDHRNIKVVLLVCQVESIPEAVNPGLSGPLKEAVPQMCEMVMDVLQSDPR